MTKLSIVLAAVGLALLAASLVPWRSAAAPAAAGDTLALTAIPTAAPAGPAEGRALFMAKGCAQCHQHAAVARSGDYGGMWSAPDLSIPRWEADYLRKWLKDPPAVKPGTNMPNLGLHDDEIEALIAFLTAR